LTAFTVLAGDGRRRLSLSGSRLLGIVSFVVGIALATWEDLV
jgi:hypothetical protein